MRASSLANFLMLSWHETVKSKQRNEPNSANTKEIRKNSDLSLLAPSGSDTFSIASFLLAAPIVNGRVSCTELQFIKRDIGADIPRYALVSRATLFPQIYPRFGFRMNLL